MNDLISRCELFNRLATIQADSANDMKGKIYAVIQAMPTATEAQQGCDTCKYNDAPWDAYECDTCCTAHNNYEPDTDCLWK